LSARRQNLLRSRANGDPPPSTSHRCVIAEISASQPAEREMDTPIPVTLQSMSTVTQASPGRSRARKR
ncbi:MAG: hypothetical protein ACYDEY_01805, partial [Acidimicrobiales bacterium]